MIVANPGTTTGSIGVKMELPNIEGLLKKLGVSVDVVKSADYKDIGSPYRPMLPEEKDLLKGTILDVYDQFVTVVAEDRKLPKDSVLEAGGRPGLVRAAGPGLRAGGLFGDLQRRGRDCRRAGRAG